MVVGTRRVRADPYVRGTDAGVRVAVDNCDQNERLPGPRRSGVWAPRRRGLRLPRGSLLWLRTVRRAAAGGDEQGET
jgi:hypothetical protein